MYMECSVDSWVLVFGCAVVGEWREDFKGGWVKV